jgi:hypothetical protein
MREKDNSIPKSPSFVSNVMSSTNRTEAMCSAQEPASGSELDDLRENISGRADVFRLLP